MSIATHVHNRKFPMIRACRLAQRRHLPAEFGAAALAGALVSGAPGTAGVPDGTAGVFKEAAGILDS